MPLRIGFDMDGVLADFSLAFHEVETRLFGPGPTLAAGQPEREEQAQSSADGQQSLEIEEKAGTGAPTAGDLQTERMPDGVKATANDAVRLKADEAGLKTGDETRQKAGTTDDATARKAARAARRRRDLIWRTIQSTPDFWMTLKPIEDDAVRRIHALMLQHRWEVFFITQRPTTAGDTVQRQTQRWLVEQGFDLPSVLVLGGSRGAAAGALRLNYHVDDSAQNCLDVIADSRARPILIVPDDDDATIASARKLGIGTAKSIGECLDILERATGARTQPGLLARIASLVGWK